MPFNPEGGLKSHFSVDPIDPVLFVIHCTGAEINDMVLTFLSGLSFLCGYEPKRPMEDADHNLNNRQTWEDLKRNSLTEGRPLSNLLSMFLQLDANNIRQVNIPELHI
jgi:hypothetical protein